MVIFNSYVKLPEGNIINIISHSHSVDGESWAQHFSGTINTVMAQKTVANGMKWLLQLGWRLYNSKILIWGYKKAGYNSEGLQL